MICNKCISSKCFVYSILILNIIKNILVLSVLLIACYDISILNPFQIIYFILSIISLFILTFYSIYKFILIILGKHLTEESFKKLWRVINLPVFLFIGIALIYDILIVPSKSGTPWVFIYYLLFLVICIIFIAFCYLDYCNIQKQIEISKSKLSNIFIDEELELKVMSKNE